MEKYDIATNLSEKGIRHVLFTYETSSGKPIYKCSCNTGMKSGNKRLALKEMKEHVMHNHHQDGFTTYVLNHTNNYNDTDRYPTILVCTG